MLSRDEIRLIKETMQQIQLPTPPWAQRLWGSPSSKKDCFEGGFAEFFEIFGLGKFLPRSCDFEKTPACTLYVFFFRGISRR